MCVLHAVNQHKNTHWLTCDGLSKTQVGVRTAVVGPLARHLATSGKGQVEVSNTEGVGGGRGGARERERERA